MNCESCDQLPAVGVYAFGYDQKHLCQLCVPSNRGFLGRFDLYPVAGSIPVLKRWRRFRLSAKPRVPGFCIGCRTSYDRLLGGNCVCGKRLQDERAAEAAADAANEPDSEPTEADLIEDHGNPSEDGFYYADGTERLAGRTEQQFDADLENYYDTGLFGPGR